MNSIRSWIPKTFRPLVTATIVLILAGRVGGQDINQRVGVFNQYRHAGRYAEAERYAAQQLSAARASQNMPEVFTWTHNLALVFNAQGRFAEAEAYYKQALALVGRLVGPDDLEVANCLNSMGSFYEKIGRYPEALRMLQRALSIREKRLGPSDILVAATLNNLANVHCAQGQFEESVKCDTRALSIQERVRGPRDREVALTLNNLAVTRKRQARYDEAEALHKRALAIRRALFQPNHPDVVESLQNLNSLYLVEGRISEMEPIQRQIIEISLKTFGAFHPATALSYALMGSLYRMQARYAESAEMFSKALAIREKVYGPEHLEVAMSLCDVAGGYERRGLHAEAEPLRRRALTIRQKLLGPEHPEVGRSLGDLAVVLSRQGRTAEAESLFRRKLAIDEKALGPNHPDVADSLGSVALQCLSTGRVDQAVSLGERALQLSRKAWGSGHVNLVSSLGTLAFAYERQNRDQDAEDLWKEALAIQEKALGSDNPRLASTLSALASLKSRRRQGAEALPLIDRCIALSEQGETPPGTLAWSYDLRANLRWAAGQRDEALADRRRAMELADQQRGGDAGDDAERARQFGGLASIFEQMVAWQAERGDAAGAFAAAERSRARTLIEQMELGGLDLLAGLPQPEAEALRARERSARVRIADLEAQLEAAARNTSAAPEPRNRRMRELRSAIDQARQQYIDAYREIRNASPAYRTAAGKNAAQVDLNALSPWLADLDAVLLEYVVGSQGAYVLAVRDGVESLVVPLTIDDEAARVLNTAPGPLTEQRLRTLLIGENREGLLARLSSSTDSEELAPRLATLWRILVPERERSAILEGKIKRVAIIPDGPLALLPFEALVVEEGSESKYLLDAGPPILYAPSSTVLYNLAQRPAAQPSPDREPVLAVGDPAYGEEGAGDASPTTSLAALSSRSRYSGAGGRLNRLEFSGWEAQWIVKDFVDAGIKAVSLSRATATERGVRYWSPGRRVLHLACHGQADEKYGNLFGALALTPGPRGSADPADDGFLTLAEVYELNLKGTELTILSACQTNYGPQQQGEGTWSLSRGFLVAGSRRAVASNWLVDDEAAATLVHYFCGALAQAEKAGKPVDHAAALQAAKRWVRQQENWKKPYYWASIVLMGPP